MELNVDYSAMDIITFSNRFKDEEACREHLFYMRWPDRFICPRCGCVDYYYHSPRELCQCKGCNFQVSVTAGTVFHKTRTPLVKWFWAIFLMSRQKSGISARALQKLLDIRSYQTAWLMCHKIRKAMADRDSRYKLAGIIEMDEAFFGGKKSRDEGGASAKTIVAVCIESHNNSAGFAAMKIIDERTSDELLKAAVEKIEKESSKLKTDGFSGYKYLDKNGFEVESRKASGKDASLVLPWVHTFISNVKSTIQGIFHGISGKHLQRFLDECVYRFNRRFKENELFDRLLLACSRAATITYSELTG